MAPSRDGAKEEKPRVYGGEGLRLTGYFNKWSTKDAKACFQQVRLKGCCADGPGVGGFFQSAKAAPPVWQRTVRLQDGCVSFQVLSCLHLFAFRIFPAEVDATGFSRLVRGEPSAVLAVVGGHGHGHGRNFFIEEPPGTVVTIYTEVAAGRAADDDAAGRGVAVWYAREADADQLPPGLPVLKQSAGSQKPGLPCRLGAQPEIEWARSMLDEFIEDYLHEDFQDELRAAWNAEGGGRHKREIRRREVCLRYQLPIISKYGFPESFQGVLRVYNSFPWYDFEVFYKDLLLKWLIDPDAQAERPLPAAEGAVPGLAGAVRRCKAEIERSVGRAPVLPAPLRGGAAAASGARLVQVELPWARTPPTAAPLVCAVVQDVLSPGDVDAFKAWIEMRCTWAPSNGHLICRINDTVLARELWMRVRRLLPEACEHRPIAGISDHLRFLRYGPGHHFLPHEDSMQTVTAAGEVPSRRSLLSALLYLSEPEGAHGRGGTRFIAPDCPEYARCGRCEAACERCVDAPVRRGSLLLFAQSLTHAGTEPLAAEKLALRTDVMYFDSPPGARPG